MEDEAYERLLCSYTNKSQRFLFKKKRKFDLQYSQLYAVRLMAMKQRLRTAAHKKWGDQVEIKQLANIKENEKCVIIGTIFRKMELQPSILKEISQEVYYFHFFSKFCFFVEMGTRCKMMSTPENTRKTQKFGPSFFPAEILYKRL